MHAVGRKTGCGNFQHQVVLYLRILHHLWFAGHRIPGPGVRDEHAQTPAKAQSDLGLLNLKGLTPFDIIPEYDQPRVNVLPGIRRSSSADSPSLMDHPAQTGKEVGVGPENADKVPALTPKEEKHRSKPIEGHSHREFIDDLAAIEMFRNKCQSVAEVQICLSRMMVSERARSEVIYGALPAIVNKTSYIQENIP